jgi:hypothetical protein
MSRAIQVILAALVLAVGLRLAWPTSPTSGPATSASSRSKLSSTAPGSATTPASSSSGAPARTEAPAAVATAAGMERSDVADSLNQNGGTIHQDLRVMHDVFTAWLTTYRSEGNPVGENEDITAALCGRNPLGVAFIARDHRAINPQGALCDRWGTPYRFHQLSGTRMEIRSAGADRRFGTTDDALWAPWAGEREG